MEFILIKKGIGNIMIFGIILFSSCESNQRSERSGEDSQNTVTSEQAGDIDETDGTDYTIRRSRAETTIENRINRIQNARDSVKNNLESTSGEERAMMEEQFEVFEERIAHLQEQQKQLEEGGIVALEAVERELDSILLEGVETTEKDRTRTVRGEGTSLDGPELNRTGTRTGTEVEKRQESIEIDAEQEGIIDQ